MAGKVVVSTLNNDTGVLATQNGMTGIAKAWVNFNGVSGASPVIRDSFNISSVTRTGTGDYTVNFTNSMPNANYSIAGQSSDNLNGYPGNTLFSTTIGVLGTPTTSSVRIGSLYTYSPSNRDAQWITFAVFSS